MIFQHLEESLELLCSQCDTPTTKRKQKMLARLIKKLTSSINKVPNTYKELTSLLLSLCKLHIEYPDEPGNIIVSMIHLDKYPDYTNLIFSYQSKTVDDDRLTSFLEFINNKIKSSEIINKVDDIVENLIKIKDEDNDRSIVETFERIIHGEYLNILKHKDEDGHTEIEIMTDSNNLESLKQKLMEMSTISRKRTRLPSGVEGVDRYLNPGFEATRIYVFGGKPGLGKSALLLNFFLNGSINNTSRKSKKPEILVYITLENDLIETLERVARITTKKTITLSTMNEKDLDEVVMTFSSLLNRGLMIKYMYPYSTTTMDIFLYLDRLSEEYTIRGIFVDYLNLVSSAEKGNRHIEKRFELGMVTAELKVLGKRFQCPVVVPTQLNTSGYEGIPTMKNLDESRQIAQNADFVGLMFEYPIEKIPPELIYKYPDDQYSLIGINIDKNRNGPKGLTFLLGHKDIFYFDSFKAQTDKQLKNRLLFKNKNENQEENAEYFSPQTNIVSTPDKFLNSGPF